MFLFLIFVFGLASGSFLLVLADRIPRNEPVFLSRSRCDNCKKALVYNDLVPFFSFIALNGKCRYCKKPLSVYYPAVELLTGILFVLTYISVIQSSSMYYVVSSKYIELAFFLFIVSCLIVIFFADLKYGLIPFVVIFPATIVTFLYLILNTQYLIPNHLYAALGASVFFLLIFLITRGRGMGFGDVVLAFFMGLLLGFPGIIVALYVAFLTGTAASLILILGGKKKFFGSTIPFGPFLILGTYVSLFWGKTIISFVLPYLGL